MKQKTNTFHLVMWTMAIGSGIFLAICIALYLTQSVPLWLTLAITFGTIFYHFAMRLAVGSILHFCGVNPGL